jgi:hypothetical protein
MLIEIQTVSITPLILDRFTEDQLIKGPKSTGSGEELTPLEQAKAKLYFDEPDGVAILPADNLMPCIIDAGRFIKVGKRQLSTRDTTIVTSFLAIIESFMVIHSVGGWRVDARGIVNQATKGRHICYRPIFDDWSLKFTIDLDAKEYSEKIARELIDRAGKAVGIGVMRPSRKGRYGQFKVECWRTKREDKPQKETLRVA